MKPDLLFGHYRLLHHMKRAQNKPSDYIRADLFGTFLQTSGVPLEYQRTVNLRRRWSYELESALRSLEAKDCIEKVGEDEGEPVYRITYDGRRRTQAALSDFGRFLLTSVFVPIVIAAVTTLVTLWLTQFFG